jgi:hypothetical protein
MSYRWTIKEIKEMVNTINELSMKHGTGRVVLQEGSQLYGRSWRLHSLEVGSHNLSKEEVDFLTKKETFAMRLALFDHPYFSNYLGDTKTEAGEKLYDICQYHVWNTHKTDKKICPTCGQKVTV